MSGSVLTMGLHKIAKGGEGERERERERRNDHKGMSGPALDLLIT